MGPNYIVYQILGEHRTVIGAPEVVLNFR